jgi:saccharopine dehydrogenase (NAD+, L-lysine-forming)
MDQHTGRWMIYGANGYTGELIAALAARRGERPLLAGRRRSAVAALAQRLELEHRVFDLDDARAVARQLEDVDALVLAAGPFSETSAKTVEACLRARTHYLDITGEVAVFEAIQARGPEAAARGVVLLPGVGFDVVPSDCLAATLAEALPGASELELAIYSRGSMSRGTLKTSLEGLSAGLVRRDGALVEVPTASLRATIPLPKGAREAVAIPWGDLSTAHFSTKIPNITVYMVLPPRMIRGLRALAYARPILRRPGIIRLLQRLVDVAVVGPDKAARERGSVWLWGRARRPDGEEVSAVLRTPESYSLTAEAALRCVQRTLAGDAAPGYQTPSTAFGSRFIAALPDCELTLESARGGAPSTS